VGGGWFNGWHHPPDWDRRRPDWDRHPAGWNPAPKPWQRDARRPPPRVTPTVVAHLGLDRPRGGAVARPEAGGARQSPGIGRQPEPPPSKSVFEPAGNRQEIQRAQQRARPAPVVPAPHRAAPVPQRAAPAPERAVPAPQRAAPPPQRAAPPPQRAAPPPPRPAPNNVFRGGSGGDARAQSARGHASGGR
jgi:hypothetical protein